MNKIDNLINVIYEDEVLEIDGELSASQTERIEQQIFLTLENNSSVIHFPKRKRKIAVLVAALIALLSFTSFAMDKQEWDISLINFMGLNSSDHLQLEGGEVTINESKTFPCVDYSDKVSGTPTEFSITSITSIGDRNSAYIRVHTNYQLPANFNPKTDYILPENHRLDITHKNAVGQEKPSSFGSVFTGIYEDGKLGFLISIENCEDLNKSHVRLSLENLYWYHDLDTSENNSTKANDLIKPEELLCEVTGDIEWKYSYKSNTETYRMLKRISSDNGEYFITKIEISPISIRLEAIRNPKDRDTEWNGEILEKIVYKDGTSFVFDEFSGAGLSNGYLMDVFWRAEEMGEIFTLKEIDYVVIDSAIIHL